MQPTLNVHRHADGSIDFDFYRRQAARRRRLSRRAHTMLWVGFFMGMAKALASFATRAAGCLSSRRPDVVQRSVSGPLLRV
jgi:hypothetical protein